MSGFHSNSIVDRSGYWGKSKKGPGRLGRLCRKPLFSSLSKDTVNSETPDFVTSDQISLLQFRLEIEGFLRIGKGGRHNSAKHPKGRSGYWCLPPFPIRKRLKPPVFAALTD
jgi:hypothetical protein